MRDGMREARPRRGPWIDYAAGAWTLLFAAPHAWWLAGISAGFPGGREAHAAAFSHAWFRAYDFAVVVISAAAIGILLALRRPWGGRVPRRLLLGAVWGACLLLSARGLAGMVADGTRDPVWWPTFLAGGILFGGVARARRRG